MKKVKVDVIEVSYLLQLIPITDDMLDLGNTDLGGGLLDRVCMIQRVQMYRGLTTFRQTTSTLFAHLCAGLALHSYRSEEDLKSLLSFA
jgi:hypothetical protein